MSVTGYHRASIAEREQLLVQIERLIGSHVLHGSESLCKLLRYLAEHALHHPGVPLKEYQIATEVFGRPADFDPQSDSTIRVQAGRLRMKLAEYYSSEGADDPIIVEVPKVIFSNGAFVGRPETGMRYFDAARDSRDLILDHYTGVGEVLAVHDLDRVFASLHRQIRVKRGSLFSLDDAKNNDLIFVGSPAENLTLRDIPSTQQFVFQRLDSGPRRGDLAVVNLRPQAGEDKYFFGSRSNTPLTEDYSVIALVRGFNPSQWVMILAGTTTLGTQAAVEFVCSENSLKDLLGRLNVSQTGEMKPFEAVLRVKVTRGVPVESSIVALRSGS